MTSPTAPAYDVSVCIGRFQTFHLGQLALIRRALASAPLCVVALGVEVRLNFNNDVPEKRIDPAAEFSGGNLAFQLNVCRFDAKGNVQEVQKQMPARVVVFVGLNRFLDLFAVALKETGKFFWKRRYAHQWI